MFAEAPGKTLVAGSSRKQKRDQVTSLGIIPRSSQRLNEQSNPHQAKG
jgi:hypothetical protein